MKENIPKWDLHYDPNYLNDLICVNIIDTDQEITVQFLDYIEEILPDDADNHLIPMAAHMTRGLGDVINKSRISLKVFKKELFLNDVTINCDEGKDPLLELYKKVEDEVFFYIEKLAEQNMKEIEKTNPGWDVDFIEEESDNDFAMNQRKLLTKIVSCSNSIRNRTLSHVASFLLIDEKYEKYLLCKKVARFNKINTDICLTHIPLNIYTCPNLGSKVIVGYTPVIGKNETGLYFVSRKDKIGGNVIADTSSRSALISTNLLITTQYVITELGESVYKNYMSFNINAN